MRGLASCSLVALLLLSLIPSRLAAQAKSPADQVKSFRVATGFRIELVAAEPDVADPVAIAFDARGRLWVAEMADYPVERTGGRVRLLEDRDRDGRFEASTLFAGGIPFPAGVLPFREGVLVCSAPDILFLSDTDGDGRMDRREVVITGFAEGNQQLRVNNLIRGVDGFLYGANGRSNGKIRRPQDPLEKALDISGRDFRLDPELLVPAAAAGPSQFGHAFDAAGRRFLSWNTVHIRQAVLSPLDLERNPLATRTATVAAISDHGDSARIYPTAPPPRTFNQEPVDHFNASCGLTIESGGLFPDAFAGCAYVCEPLVGLVHRDRMTQGAGPLRTASRGETESEFLTSSDPWCHPVNLASGPDGALYVVDLYRELVEHPDYVPKDIRASIDFGNGRGHGRIWRIVPAQASLLTVEDLETLEPDALARRVAHPNGVTRLQAARLILERRLLGAVPGLEGVAAEASPPAGRIAALWTLERLGALKPELLREATRTSASDVRHAAALILRDRAKQGTPAHGASGLDEIARLAGDPDAEVRLVGILALGDVRVPLSGLTIRPALLEACRRDGGDSWLQAAILSSAAARAGNLFDDLLAEPERVAPGFFAEIAELAGVESPERAGGFAERIETLVRRTPSIAAIAGLDGLLRGLSRAGKPLPDSAAPALDAVRRILSTSSAAPDLRAAAALVLSRDSWERARPALLPLLSAREEPAVARSAAKAIARFPSGAAGEALLQAWPAATPAMRETIADGLLARPEHREALAAAIEQGGVRATEIDVVRRSALLRLLEPARREALAKLMAPANSDRAAVVAQHATPSGRGDAARGALVFDKQCSTCHRLGSVGHAIGPDITGFGKKSRSEILNALLDPNQSVVPGFGAYAITLRSGETLVGIIAGETGAAVTLRRPGGIEEAIPRTSIAGLTATGLSLMPENLETVISPEEIEHLLEFLKRV